MPIQIVPDSLKKLGKGISRIEIQLLVDNYRRIFRKSTGATTRPLDAQIDSKCARFTMEEIEELLKNNKYDKTKAKDYELRVYFGAHSNIDVDLRRIGVPEGSIELCKGQQTVILVLAEPIDPLGTKQDCLDVGNSVSIASVGALQGLEVGTLCPPGCGTGHFIN